ncbi:MAG: hypothetical protein K0U74_06890 [Alphaproteobacteria bacterium]|nr:hypothetical protein [Alphaproteobacteria bacterium]
MRPTAIILTTTGLVAQFALAAGSVHAREACVRCDGPYALYRCVIDDAQVPPAASIHLVCMTELAKRHGHRTCSVDRNITNADCAGSVAEIYPAPDFAWPQSPPPAYTATTPQPGTEPAHPDTDTAQNPPGVDPKPKGPPKTVEELAKQTAKASKEGLETAGETVVDAAETAAKSTGDVLKKTGKTIGTAAEKTWRCLSSLFGDC